MQMSELARFIRALQYIGWTDEQINKLILYIEEGGELQKLDSLKQEITSKE